MLRKSGRPPSKRGFSEPARRSDGDAGVRAPASARLTFASGEPAAKVDNRAVTNRLEEEHPSVRPSDARNPGEEVGPADSRSADAVPPRRHPRRFPAAVVIVVVVALLIVAIAGFEIYLRTGGDSPEPADAVVVLGPGRDGERLERAEALVDEQVAETLVISMGRGGQRAATDAACAEEPTDFEVICFKADPFTTRGEAQLVARLAAARGWTKLLVVTSDYHVRRARLLFGRCFDGSLVVVGAPSSGGPAVVLTDAHEGAGLLYANLVARGC